MLLATNKQLDSITDDLIKFIHRVALDENASPAEIAALPEIAKVICKDTVN